MLKNAAATNSAKLSEQAGASLSVEFVVKVQTDAPLKSTKKRSPDLLLEEVYSSTEEDQNDPKDEEKIAEIIRKLTKVDEVVTNGDLLSENEKVVWRYTYRILKKTTKEYWGSVDSKALRDAVNFCLGKLLLRTQNTITYQEACEEIELIEEGLLVGMAEFLKTYKPIPTN